MPFYALMRVTYHKLYQATLQRGLLAHCDYGIVAARYATEEGRLSPVSTAGVRGEKNVESFQYGTNTIIE